MPDVKKIEPGLSLVKHYRVEPTSTARHLGSGGVEVLATPELVRMMEETALAVVGAAAAGGARRRSAYEWTSPTWRRRRSDLASMFRLRWSRWMAAG